MKKSLAILGFVFLMNAQAEVNPSQNKYEQPSAEVIAKNRACFQELEVQGCGKFEDDHEQFRSCMSNAHGTLDEHCQKLMSHLYGTH